MASSKHVHRMDSPAGHYIPEDLIINILSRLPVKLLLRFKAVSKAWLSIISNPNFINFHLGHATSSENNNSLLVHSFRGTYNSISLHCIDSGIDLPYYEGELRGNLFIVGSCNGIVCAALNSRLDWVRDRGVLYTSNDTTYQRHVHIYLWNPATKQSKLLPPLVPDTSTVHFGFGFDPIANDFKVVCIKQKIKNSNVYAMIYYANTNAWKNIESPPRVPYDSIADCVRGVLYWRCEYGVMRFDLNNEVFYFHTFPDNVQKTIHDLEYDYGHYMRVIDAKDSIHVVMYPSHMGSKRKNILWSVNDGFEGSWTSKFSFDVTQTVDWVHGYLTNNGHILFKTEDGLWLSYDSDKREMETVTLAVGTRETFRHTESLASIRGSERLGEMLTKLKMEDLEEQECLCGGGDEAS